jgi:hypothetical protein
MSLVNGLSPAQIDDDCGVNGNLVPGRADRFSNVLLAMKDKIVKLLKTLS